MNGDDFLRQVVIQDLGWTLVHFLWEGGVIAGICSFHTAPKANRAFAIAPFSSAAHWTFSEPEVAVQFKCDLHPWNFAYVGVFAHPYFAVTDEQGRFSIPGVPAGQYTLETFHPSCSTSSKTIAVTNGTTTVDFEVKRSRSWFLWPGSAEPQLQPIQDFRRVEPIKTLYSVQIGPHAYVGLTNLPDANPVSITFSRWKLYSTIADEPDDHAAVFRLTNGESTSITLWNVRVQIPSTSGSPEISGGGAIHAGWQTIQNDYPGEGGGVHEAGASGELWVKSPPKGTPWRVCVLYSKERAEDERRRPAERRHYGNYEVISATLPATKK
jgi:Carboxypeptidase regulatory-like domain